MKKIKSDFISKGVRCDGDLYLPEGASKPPVIIMAHGLAALKAFRLPAFAEKFVERKMAAFLFDYRTFGESDGKPRHLMNPFHHVQDWLAAISHVRTIPEIDASRIALWGSSFSGGHVIIAAAKEPDIAAVVSQVPLVSGMASIGMKSISDIVRATMYGYIDYLKAALRLPPHYSPAIAQPGSFAAMNSEECYPGYLSIVPEGSDWENKMTSRGFINLAFYNPINHAKHVRAPVLIIGGKNDSLIPIKAVKKTAKRLPQGTLVELDCNHFEPYTGTRFEQCVKIEADFLEKQLFGTSASIRRARKESADIQN